jgi:hypothetical protein
MYRTYGQKARFLTIYIKEAHPTDEWRMDSNDDQGICYTQPRSTPDRLAIAADFVERFHYEIPLLVDPLENVTNDLYAAWPERLYIIDEQGRIVYKGGMGPFEFHPEEVEAWLAKRFP